MTANNTQPVAQTALTRVYEMPEPAIVSDAAVVRCIALNMLTKEGRNRVRTADALVGYWQNAVMPIVNGALGSFVDYLSWTLMPEIRATGLVPEEIPQSSYWAITSVDANRQGRLIVAVKPDWLHSPTEFTKIVERVLPQIGDGAGLSLYEGAFSIPNHVMLCTQAGVMPKEVVRGYLTACNEFTQA